MNHIAFASYGADGRLLVQIAGLSHSDEAGRPIPMTFSVDGDVAKRIWDRYTTGGEPIT